LAVKSANGTNSDSDRSYIQNEVDQLVTEIDRVAQTTKFNETYLLKGDESLEKGYSYSYKVNTFQQAVATFASDAATEQGVTFTFNNTDGAVSNDTVNELVKSLRDQGVTLTTSTDTKTGILELNGDAATNYQVVTTDVGKFTIKDLEGRVVATANMTISTKIYGQAVTLLADKDSLKAQTSAKELAQFYDTDGNAISANALDNYFAYTGTDVKKLAASKTLYDAVGTAIVTSNAEDLVQETKDVTTAINIKFQVGADTSSSNKISINIEAMSAKGLGINGLKVSTTNTADSAVNYVSAALQKVSRQRSSLGAIQNRLEHTINNLDNVVENTTSAESEIRDTDMATEMVTYSNANILAQAGQAMLAQANQSNQGVLTLLG
jgi:flagellin